MQTVNPSANGFETERRRAGTAWSLQTEFFRQ
jgi:hypothetical protein